MTLRANSEPRFFDMAQRLAERDITAEPPPDAQSLAEPDVLTVSDSFSVTEMYRITELGPRYRVVARNVLQNPNFEEGLTGWSVVGMAERILLDY